jgi:hypothetical protein
MEIGQLEYKLMHGNIQKNTIFNPFGPLVSDRVRARPLFSIPDSIL